MIGDGQLMELKILRESILEEVSNHIDVLNLFKNQRLSSSKKKLEIVIKIRKWRIAYCLLF